MKHFITLFLLLLSAHSYGQDIFNRPRKYDINVTYQPSLPTVYGSLLMEKQRIQDQRLEWVQGRIDEIAALPAKLWGYGKVPGWVIDETNRNIRAATNTINSEKYSDFTNTTSFLKVKDMLNFVESEVYDMYRKDKN